MRRLTLIFAILPLFLGGLMLSRLWSLSSTESPASPALVEDYELSVSSFYTALNDYLYTGDEIPLRRMLHPEFALHRPGSEWHGTVDDYLAQLATFRELFPGVQLLPKAGSASGSFIAVDVDFDIASQTEFAGITLEPQNVLGNLNLIRFERGTAAEVWDWATISGRLTPYPALTIELPFTPASFGARAGRWSVSESDSVLSQHFEHVVLIVESGAVSIRIEEGPPADTGFSANPDTAAHAQRMERSSQSWVEVIEQGLPIVFDPGEAIYIPALSKYRITTDREGAVLTALLFGAPSVGMGFPPVGFSAQDDEGGAYVDVQLLARSPLIELPDEHVVISFGRAWLTPGSSLEGSAATGLRLVTSVKGEMALTANAGGIHVWQADAVRPEVFDGVALLRAGGGASYPVGADPGIEVTGKEPADTWFFSVAPA